ncbi:hypothetical protein J1G42_03000 [Cellulomonas sp. zg-ZUI222]|uniref:hypothetical protein n=1 Tax=Cellulomonas wangleii TaxID=2816956 RepID=UPI001A93E040|nr:hypothetical protein [Cellulomonas wangleii]MBO0919793.1 hypothetical protein [Cellulomonas wangleii]
MSMSFQESPFPLTPAQRRAALIAAERERRQAQRERRELAAQRSVLTAMSQAERAQRSLLLHHVAGQVRGLAQRVAHEERLEAIARDVDAAIGDLAARAPGLARWRRDDWSAFLRTALATGDGIGPVLVVLAERGVVSLALERLGLLRAAVGRDMTAVVGGPDSWRVARGAAAVLGGLRPAPDDLRAMARSADLAMVDSALDHDPGLVALVRSEVAASERTYLKARTRPRLVDDDALVELGWQEEIRRRQLIAGALPGDLPGDSPWVLRQRLFDGDETAGELVPEVLPELSEILGGLTSPRQFVATRGADPSLWRLLDSALGDDLGGTGHPTFDIWRRLARARAALHSDDRVGAWAVMRDVRSVPFRGPVAVEVHNLAVYCAVLSNEVNTARTHLRALRRLGHSEAVARNVTLAERTLDRMRDGDKRSALEDFESPWVVLGLDEPGELGTERPWDARWVALLREIKTDTTRRIRVNRAKQRLAAGEEQGRHFVVPLAPDCYVPARRGVLFPELVPMPRRTPIPDVESVRSAVQRAWAEAISTALHEARPTPLWQELHDARR